MPKTSPSRKSPRHHSPSARAASASATTDASRMPVTQVRLPQQMRSEMEKLVSAGVYTDTSELIRDAIRRLLLEMAGSSPPKQGSAVERYLRLQGAGWPPRARPTREEDIPYAGAQRKIKKIIEPTQPAVIPFEFPVSPSERLRNMHPDDVKRVVKKLGKKTTKR